MGHRAGRGAMKRGVTVSADTVWPVVVIHQAGPKL